MLSEKMKGLYGTVVILSIASILIDLYSLIFNLTYNGGIGLLVDPNTDRVYPMLQQITLNYAPAIAPYVLFIIIFIIIIFISLFFIKDKSRTNKTSDLSIKLLTWAISFFLIVSILTLILQPPLLQMLPFIGEGIGWLLLYVSYSLSLAYYILGIISFILLVIGFINSKKVVNLQ